MKLRTVLCVTMLAFGSLACSGMVDMPGIPSASLSEPWSSMDLPVDGGNVLYSDEKSLSITYEGNQVKDLAGQFRKGLVGADWKKVAEVENDGSYVLNYKKDGKTVGVAVTFANGQTIAGLTMQ